MNLYVLSQSIYF